MYYVYIIKSLKTGEFYKGITNNLERRVNQHRNKDSWIKNKLPLKLVHAEFCNSREKARESEKFFKSGFGREVIKELDN